MSSLVMIHQNEGLDKAIERLDAELPRGWEPKHMAGNADGQDPNIVETTLHQSFLVDNLLSRISNVERLSFQLSSAVVYGTFWLPSGRLESLKELLLSDSGGCGFDLAQADGRLERAPNLKTLELHLCNEMNMQVHFENMTSLTLFNPVLQPSQLRRFVSSCPKLTSFSFRYLQIAGGLVSANINEATTHLKELVDKLDACAKRLEHISVQVHMFSEELSVRDEELVPSFTKFSALKTLTLNEGSLGLDDEHLKRIDLPQLLPMSIEVVDITHAGPMFRLFLKDLDKRLRLCDFPQFKE